MDALAQWEQADLDASIRRIEDLLALQPKAGARELGILLSLHMAREIRDGLEIGTRTGPLVELWLQEHPESTVEESIAFAREFLLRPGQIKESLSRKLMQ